MFYVMVDRFGADLLKTILGSTPNETILGDRVHCFTVEGASFMSRGHLKVVDNGLEVVVNYQHWYKAVNLYGVDTEPLIVRTTHGPWELQHA